MTTNNAPTYKFKSELVFKGIVTFTEDKVLLNEYAPKEAAIFFYTIEPEDVLIVYEMSNPICECGNKMHKHNILDWEMDKQYPIHKYQYRCPKCGKTMVTPLPGIVKPSCNYTNDIREMVVNLYSKEHISYAHTTDFLNEQYGMTMSRQTIYNYNDKDSDEYLSKKEEIIKDKLKEEHIEPTGFPGHDEAFLKINGEKYALLSMVDSNNQMIMNEQLIREEEYRDFLETFIIYSQKDLSVYSDPNTPNPMNHLFLADFKKNTLIGDGLKEYPTIAQKANMNFHPCIFHKIMNQRKPSWTRQRSIKNSIRANKNKIKKNEEYIEAYKGKYKGQKRKIGNTDKKRRREKDNVTKKERENKKLRTKNRKLQKEYDEYEKYNTRISEIFVQDTIKDAKRRFNILNNKREHLPEEIADFIKRLEKDLDATLSHIENKNIPKTNNWLELFFKIVFPKKYRKRFKEIKGVERFLRSGKIRWYENVVFNEKITLEKENIWSELKNYATEINEKLMIQVN